ncbi:unnamed protein product, partial [Discosporangium mesarthrocarpum]
MGSCEGRPVKVVPPGSPQPIGSVQSCCWQVVPARCRVIFFVYGPTCVVSYSQMVARAVTVTSPDLFHCAAMDACPCVPPTPRTFFCSAFLTLYLSTYVTHLPCTLTLNTHCLKLFPPGCCTRPITQTPHHTSSETPSLPPS